jgi:hypothetical protein
MSLCNSLSDAPYQNPSMVLNGQGLIQHPFGDALCCDSGTMLCKDRVAASLVVCYVATSAPECSKNVQRVFTSPTGAKGKEASRTN